MWRRGFPQPREAPPVLGKNRIVVLVSYVTGFCKHSAMLLPNQPGVRSRRQRGLIATGGIVWTKLVDCYMAHFFT